MYVTTVELDRLYLVLTQLHCSANLDYIIRFALGNTRWERLSREPCYPNSPWSSQGPSLNRAFISQVLRHAASSKCLVRIKGCGSVISITCKW